ncbi:type II secretion system protein GspK [Kiritimatiellaeota bacterium B1221]|nr:type II secretion system protein GspK [Kiritimatiellaeota bacterium B1221]
MRAKDHRRGSVYLLVLLVMISSMTLVAGLQNVLVRRTKTLDRIHIQQKLRNALLLGLEESTSLLLEDDDFAVDGLTDNWAIPLEFTTTEGVHLEVILQDAQRQFNLNHLSLPVSSSMPFTWMDVFEDLVRSTEMEIPAQIFTNLQNEIDVYEVWFDDPQMLTLLVPDAEALLEVSDSLCALPRPESRPLLLNINTVQPEVLEALVGDSLQGWVDNVLIARETEPLRNLSGVLQLLPTQVQPLLMSVLDVRSEYFTARLVARLDQSEQTLTALFKRSEGNVEVLRCQW